MLAIFGGKGIKNVLNFKGTALLFFTSFEVPESTTRKIFCKSLLSYLKSAIFCASYQMARLKYFWDCFCTGGGSIGALGAHILKGGFTTNHHLHFGFFMVFNIGAEWLGERARILVFLGMRMG